MVAGHQAIVRALVAVGAEIIAPCPDAFVFEHQAVIGRKRPLVRFCINHLEALPEG